MTEPANKKSKDGRYRLDSTLIGSEPVFEPLTDLDNDEDAIDRLLIDTGFDAEEDYSSSNDVDKDMGDDPFYFHADQVSEFDAFNDNALLAKLITGDDEPIEPVDLGSPVASIEISSAPEQNESPFAWAEPLKEVDDRISAEGDDVWTNQNRAAESNGLSHEHFNLTVEVDEDVKPVDLDSAVFEIDLTEVPRTADPGPILPFEPFEHVSPPIKQGPDANTIWQSQMVEGTTAAPAEAAAHNPTGVASGIEAVAPGKVIDAETPSPASDYGPLLPMQEDAERQFDLLEKKTRKAERLSYAALVLSVAALCAALIAAYLNAQSRADLAKLKDMMAILEEDMTGLNEKSDGNDHSPEENTESSNHISDKSASKPEAKTVAANLSPAPATKPTPVDLRPKQPKASKDKLVLPIKKSRELPPKPSLLKTHAKSSPAPVTNESGAKWTVNLASFRHIEDARKKAKELRRKGISVKLMKVDIKRTTWYRLIVPGFKTKVDANSHSSQLKKLLGQNSIWVAAI